MVVQTKVLTLNGSAQQLTGINDLCRSVLIQADNANAHIVKVGDSTITSSVYSFEVPIPVTSIPGAPIQIQGPVQLDSIYVLGTNTEKLRIAIVSM